MFSVNDSLNYPRLRCEGSSLTYWNAGFLQHMPINSNLRSTTTSGKSLIYNGTEWTSGYTTDINGMPINTTIPISDGQVLTYNGTQSKWTNEYPRNLIGIPINSTVAPTNNQILAYNLSANQWVPVNNTGTQGLPGTVAFGNVVVVDSRLGTNSGSLDGNAVNTIELAISIVNNAANPPTSRSGITIWIMPGTYNLSAGITIPANTNIRGMSLQGCKIQMLNVTTDTTLITMGENSRLEDVTLNLTSNSLNDVNLTAISFPNTTSTTSKVRVCLINVTANYTGISTKTVCGIFSNGTTTNPSTILSTNSVQRSTTNVTNLSSSGSITRGWYFTGALQFSVRDTVIFANGVGAIGIETTNTSSFIIVKTSTVSGTLYDIKQPTGLTVQNSGIQLCATDLVNANADDNGFTVNIESTNLYFSIIGNNIGNDSHYLFPGTINYNDLIKEPIGIPFSQNIIIFGGILSVVTSGTMSGTATINLYNSTSASSLSNPTPFITFSANNSNKVSIFNNKSSSFKKQINFLHVQLVTSGSISNSIRGLLLGLSLY